MIFKSKLCTWIEIRVNEMTKCIRHSLFSLFIVLNKVMLFEESLEMLVLTYSDFDCVMEDGLVFLMITKFFYFQRKILISQSILGGFCGVEWGVKLGVRVAKGDLFGVRGVRLWPTRLLPGVIDLFRAWFRCQCRDFGVWWVLWYSLWVARIALAPTDNVHIVQRDL